MKCKVKNCNQMVIGNNNYCYFHRKVKAGLFGRPNEYTMSESVDVFPHALSNPSEFVPVKGTNKNWEMN